ncbi:MAG TPA: RNA polymerase sigma-70 factor [Flavisolibacter sp.]|nr:RNA polymerase sigma-70 factor [Flavisolibacter sp.]
MPPVSVNFKADYKPKLAALEYPIMIAVKDERLFDFETHFHTHFEALHRYAFTLLKDSEDAKDIVQQVYIKLWEKSQDLEVQQSVKSYLYRAVYNQCLNKIRDTKVRSRYAEGIMQEKVEGVFSDETVVRETQNRINLAIESLPAQCSIIFKKSRFEEKKYGEIATELGLSVKTVEAQMSKALKVLREKLLIVLSLINLIIH